MAHKDNSGINFLNISSAWAIFPQNITLLRFQNLVPPNQKFIQIAWSYNQLQKYLRHCTPVAYNFCLNWLAYNLVFVILSYSYQSC